MYNISNIGKRNCVLLIFLSYNEARVYYTKNKIYCQNFSWIQWEHCDIFKVNSKLQGQMLIILFSFWKEIIVRMEISIGIL